MLSHSSPYSTYQKKRSSHGKILLSTNTSINSEMKDNKIISKKLLQRHLKALNQEPKRIHLPNNTIQIDTKVQLKKYPLVLFNRKLKYINPETLDDLRLPEPISLREDSISYSKHNNTITPIIRKKNQKFMTPDIKLQQKIKKNVGELIYANVNQSKIMSLYRQSALLNEEGEDSHKLSTSNKFFPKKASKIDRLLMRMTLPNAVFEEYLTEKDILPQDKYTKFKRVLLKGREKVSSVLDDLKKAQVMNESLIKIYRAKLVTKKYT